jgi:hypothetical protein
LVEATLASALFSIGLRSPMVVVALTRITLQAKAAAKTLSRAILQHHANGRLQAPFRNSVSAQDLHRIAPSLAPALCCR